jgi:hypothetical protein
MVLCGRVGFSDFLVRRTLKTEASWNGGISLVTP